MIKSIKTLTATLVAIGLTAGSVSAADYEYSSTTFDNPPTAMALNEWSEKGLELITIIPFAGDDNSMSYAAYFKRETNHQDGIPSKVTPAWKWYQQRWEQFQLFDCIARYRDEHGLADILPLEALDACQ